jgi:hypothetical protein
MDEATFHRTYDGRLRQNHPKSILFNFLPSINAINTKEEGTNDTRTALTAFKIMS